MEDMPKVINVSIKNVEVGLCWSGLRVRGYEESMLENINIECIETTTVIDFVDGIHLNNVKIKKHGLTGLHLVMMLIVKNKRRDK